MFKLITLQKQKASIPIIFANYSNMAQQVKPFSINIQQIQQSLLENQGFIEQLKHKLTSCSSLQVQSKIMEQKYQSQTCIQSNIKQIKKSDLDMIIAQISEILNDLISQKLQYELNEIIQENNNVLLQIKENLLLQQKENQSILQINKPFLQQQNKDEISFSDVHRLINEEKKKFEGLNENINDAELEKSLSCLVDYKFQSIEEKVLTVDKRLKIMEDKYETNLKSIWNVLSMTEGAVFDFISKEKEKEKQKKDYQIKEDLNDNNKKTETQKKSTFFKLW